MTIVGCQRMPWSRSKQLNKLIDVIKVTTIEQRIRGCEMALIKISQAPKTVRVLRGAEIFRAKVVDATPDAAFGATASKQDQCLYRIL
jgi:acetolactate synthase small subunit